MNLGIHFRLMVVIMAQCGVNLCQRKVRVLKMNLFWAPTVGNLILRDFNDLCSSVVYPRNPVVVESNMSAGDRWHTSMKTVYPSKTPASKAEILKELSLHRINKDISLTSPEVSG